MADWVISSKLAPSISRRPLFPRDHLVYKLDKVLDARAALLHAPAGFGKTSLLAYWWGTLAEREIPAAWLSLDDHDQDLFQFLSYLLESCKVNGLVSKSRLTPLPSGVSESSPRVIVSAVLTELGKCSNSNILILDDFHRVETAENCYAVNQLLARLPTSVHVVISAREHPSLLPLANLRVREEVIEIDHLDLRFSEQEIRTWLGPLVEPSAPGNWATQLFARTEGWPIALKTVRRWVADGASVGETLEQLSGRSSDLSDYFLEQVFDDLDEAVRDFLLRTSILKRVNGDLANKLCEIDDAWRILEDLERRDIFVESLDRERTWYRYHRLFSEFLQERMRRRSEAMAANLHRIASGWFREQGLVSEAVQHAIASGQAVTTADLFESLGGWHYALKGHVGALERALCIVDDKKLVDYPRLWLGKIFLAVRRGEINEAQEMFNQLAAARESRSTVDSEFRCELLIMRSLLNRYADDDITEVEVQQLEGLSESLPHENHLMHAVRYNLLCAMHAQCGDFDSCLTAGDKAIRRFRAMGSVFGETFIYFHEGYACMAQGRLRDAEVLYGAGRDLALEHFGADSDLAAIAAVFLAEAAYEKNNIHEAARLLDVALPHIERFDGWLEVYVAAYTTLMKLAHCSRDWESLAEARDRARSTATHRGLLRLRSIVDMQALELEYLRRPASASDHSMGSLDGINDNPAEHPTLRQLRVSVAARTHLQAGHNGQAIKLLERERRRSYDGRLIRSYISFSILLAVAHWAQGRRDAAIDAFEAALSPCLFEGIKRPFIEEGDALVDVIHDLPRAVEKQRGNRLRDRFLVELITELNAASAQPPNSRDQFTPREQEVLRYLVQGRSNREIAEAIPISINTVKFHVKNIFVKLGVHTRKDAVTASIRRRFF